jgi:EAL domain-containing protein (putative c-di-GMP-specific phosphodiesterase class I)
VSEQWHTLRELGCDLGQGFLFARPMDVSSITSYLEDAHLRTSTGLPPFEEPQADAA